MVGLGVPGSNDMSFLPTAWINWLLSQWVQGIHRFFPQLETENVSEKVRQLLLPPREKRKGSEMPTHPTWMSMEVIVTS